MTIVRDAILLILFFWLMALQVVVTLRFFEQMVDSDYAIRPTTGFMITLAFTGGLIAHTFRDRKKEEK